MTLPSTEELQWLLDAATPGEWQFQDHEEWEHVAGPEYPPMKVQIAHGVEVDGVDLFGQANDGVLEDYPGNLRIASLAPVLAAEVIRLREEIKTLREHYRELEKGYDDASIPFSPGRWFSRNAIQDLTRILEGDQE